MVHICIINFKSKIQPIKNHVGNHYITYQNKKYLVNSFHNFGIFDLDKKQITSFADDKSIGPLYPSKNYWSYVAS